MQYTQDDVMAIDEYLADMDKERKKKAHRLSDLSNGIEDKFYDFGLIRASEALVGRLDIMQN